VQGEIDIQLSQIKPTAIALLLAALFIIMVGTYTDNGGFQLAGFIMLFVAFITAFNQARVKGK
jgi:hypothetical protein